MDEPSVADSNQAKDAPKDKIWTVSNVLSMSRIVIAVPLASALYHSQVVQIISLTLLASLTDFLDGLVARRRNEVTEFGKIIDPLADKILVGSAACAIMLSGKIELWFFVLVIARDVLILAGGIFVRRRLGITLMSNTVGKYAVAIVALALMLIAVDIPGPDYRNELIAAAAGALVLSFLNYLGSFLRVIGVRG